jgi:hypothetical protein
MTRLFGYDSFNKKMSSRKFEYRGDLSSTPLPEILATIHRYRVPGVVSVSRDGRARRIYVDEGLVLFAASNEPELSLSTCLRNQGVLDEETAREAEERRARDGLKMGQVLLQMGILTPERLNAAITGLIREILQSAFEWEAGEAVFEVGARWSADFVRVDLPIPEVVVEGIRRAANVKRLVQRLGSAPMVLERTGGQELSAFTPSEQSFYKAVDGKTPLQQLSARGPGSQADNVRLLYAFFCLGLLRKRTSTAPGAKKIHYKTGGGSLAN